MGENVQTRIKNLLAKKTVGSLVQVAGWIRTRRDTGGFSFLEVNDGSCLANIQVIADGSLANYEAEIRKLSAGCSVMVEGTLQASPAKGQDVEILAAEVVVVGWADPEHYPLQKKRHSFEFLREISHLRPRTNALGAVARVRSRMSYAVHTFFQERGFCQVHTPIITTSDCEGAGEMFQLTAMETSLKGEEAGPQDFFGRKAGLTVSGQLQAEVYALALGNVYTFGPTFRAENSNTSRHLAEFWMIEPEMAFADLQDDAALAAALLQHLFASVLRRCCDDLTFFEQRVQPGLLARLERLATSEFRTITYAEAVERLQKSGHAFEFPPQWGMDLQSEHERYLTEEVFQGPIVVVDYPREIKAFYMRRNDDGRTVAAMDVLLPEVGEIVGGSQREERLDLLEDAIRARGLDPAHYSWYLDLRRFGSVPHAGFGLGFERLVQFCTGMHNIRDAIPYPRAPRTCEF